VSLLLHDNPHSSNAQKARLMLEILGVDYDIREVPFGSERADWHVAVNPTGGIPALIDGDFRLAESNTILRYLADREGRDDLYPRDPQARATVDWVLDLWALVMRPALFASESAFYGIVLGQGLFAKEPADNATVGELFAKAVAKLTPAADVLDPVGPWACLGRMTIADVAATPVLYRALHAPVDLTAVPRLQQWAVACAAIPAWQPLAAISGVPHH
jgi:glutathione S-transferase